MVLAPERPPETHRTYRTSRVISVVIIVIVLALAIFGLVTLIGDDPETGAGPGPIGPVGPQETVGPQGTDDAVVGSGTIVSETRTVAGFTGVVIAGEGDVELVQSEQASVTLRTDDNLVALVTTEVRDGILYIDTVDSVADVDPSDGLRFDIGIPDIARVGITGAGSITLDGVVAGELSIVMEGAGTIELSGVEADRLVVNATGAGLMTVAGNVQAQQVTVDGTVGYQAGNLESVSAVVETNTVSDVVVWVTGDLEYLVRGVGSFSYFGEPATSGSGSARALGAK